MAAYVSTGVKELDRLMGGGLLPGNAYLLEVGPGTGETAFIASFLDYGIRHKELCLIVGYDRPHEEVLARLKEFGFDGEASLRSGSLLFADLCVEGKNDPGTSDGVLMTENILDPNSILKVYYQMIDIANKKLMAIEGTGVRAVVDSLSTEIMNYKFEPTYKSTKRAIQMARAGGSPTLTTLNPHMFDETVVASFEHLFDSTIVLSVKEVEGRFKKFIRVKESPIPGFYSDEVAYEIVNRRPNLLTSASRPTDT